jgi:hypothetical protein
MDQNSVSADPGFVSVNNLRAKASAVDSAGTPLAYVTDDIDGEPRDPVFPDIGADEFIFGFNYAPTITSVPDTLAYVDSLYQYQVIVDDQDGDTLTFGFQSAPGFLVIDEATGMVEGIPSDSEVGEHPVEISVDDGNGNRVIQSFTLTVETVTGIDRHTVIIPGKFTLFQNYPNPFNPSTTIRFTIPEQANVTLIVYDLLGRKVATLIDDRLQPGEYSQLFDGGHFPSGVYIYRIYAGEHVETKRLILIK